MTLSIEQVVQKLEEDIVFGVFPPMSRIVEEQIVERFKVKRHAVREAFQILEDRGLVARVKNKGTSVVELTPSEVEQIYFMRELLEVAASRITLLPANHKVVGKMKSIQEMHSEAISQSDFRSVFRLNVQFHAVQYSACANRELEEAISFYARKGQTIRATMYYDQSHMKKVEDQHWKIIHAMEENDNENLSEVVRAHIWPSSQEYARKYRIRHGM